MAAGSSAARPVVSSGPQPRRKLNITVLMGGPSAEREVSLMSGRAVADTLERAGYRVSRADITPEDTSALDARGIEMVFIAMHGDFGESGQVQRLCESRGLAYTGSGVRASQLAMDKSASKEIFRNIGLATPDWMVPDESFTAPSNRGELDHLGLPVVVKPVDGGSSIDITIARDAPERDQAVRNLLDKGCRPMVERYVQGRELTVSILGRRPLDVLEIIPAGLFYDYEAKYTDCGTRYVFDHGLDDVIVRQTQKAALSAHHALGCRDMSRVDFIMDQAGAVQVLEVNTIPGFTSHSLLPMAADHAGLNFRRCVETIVDEAMERTLNRPSTSPPRRASSGLRILPSLAG